MKILGAELQDFLNHGWPSDDWFWETEAFENTPGNIPEPGVTYDTDDLGPLFWQGRGPDPSNGQGLDLAAQIRKWRKTRDARVVMIRLPNTVSDADLRAALKPLKGTIER